MKNVTIDMKKIKFGKDGLVPVVVQDYESGEVLMLMYANEEAVQKTLSSGFAHYYSRSRKNVYKFGDVLGNYQKLKAMFLDHDSDTILLKVDQAGKADPEQGTFTCFPQQLVGEYNTIGGEMFGRLQRIIGNAKKNPEEGDYTSFLFVRGLDRIAKKVGEEAVELVIASKGDEKKLVVGEAADLLFHVMVLLNSKNVKLSEVCGELCKRNR
ncbi:MAG: bifunctional phosphoribosyl-AMP cyclohydrolase/phosphoribosyl-ATP diphosphatase HisIE [Clostridia bacterium]|nr:bifunctional phosphoribosyl-AMP cyclohydrolase/phosphoribosyl-ATP diphosphatase HisIE [Clostridia bacterium]